MSVMIDLLDDLNRAVARAAACALGQMGRIEARPILASLLRQGPSEDVIDAVSVIADEECIVLLGRIARSTSPLSDAALNALENIDHPRASTVALAVRGRTSAIPRGSAVGNAIGHETADGHCLWPLAFGLWPLAFGRSINVLAGLF
jgi:hypothetical protein